MTSVSSSIFLAADSKVQVPRLDLSEPLCQAVNMGFFGQDSFYETYDIPHENGTVY